VRNLSGVFWNVVRTSGGGTVFVEAAQAFAAAKKEESQRTVRAKSQPAEIRGNARFLLLQIIKDFQTGVSLHSVGCFCDTAKQEFDQTWVWSNADRLGRAGFIGLEFTRIRPVCATTGFGWAGRESEIISADNRFHGRRPAIVPSLELRTIHP